MSKKLIIAIVAVVLAVAIPVTAFVILGGKKEPEKADYAAQYAALESAALHNMVNTLLSDNISIRPADPEKYAATAKVDISLSENILALMGLEGVTFADLGMPNTLTAKTDTYIDGFKQKVVLDLLLNGQTILSGNMISDPMSGVSYLAIPTISNYWLKAQNEAMAQLPDVSSLMNGLSEIAELLPTLREPLNKYIDLALAEMNNVEKGTETITVMGKSETATVYTNYITEKVATNAVKAVLTAAKSDSTIQSLLPANVNLEATIDMLLSSLPEDPSTAKEDAIVLKVYQDQSGKVIGRSFDLSGSAVFSYFVSSDGSAAKLSIVASDEGFALEINKEGAVLYAIQKNESVKMGSLTFSGDKQNGAVKLALSKTVTGGNADQAIVLKWATADDKFTLTLATESGAESADLGYLIISGDETKGSVEFKLADTLEASLFGTADADLSLLCNWDANDSTTAARMIVSLMGSPLVTFRFYDIEDIEPADVVFPSNALDAANSAAMNAYVNSLNLNILRQNLINAGIPALLIDAIFSSMGN